MERTIERYHDFSYGHRVHGHENKCASLHGHNGRVYFTITAPELDLVGRVLDFGEVGKRLCTWLEENWDHKFLVWIEDNSAIVTAMRQTSGGGARDYGLRNMPFNPTAEELAGYLLNVVGPEQLKDTPARLVKVQFFETRKCSATAYANSLVTKEDVEWPQIRKLIDSNVL